MSVSRTFRVAQLAVITAALGVCVISCKREERHYRVEPALAVAPTDIVSLTTLHPGGRLKDPAPQKNPYEGNAQAVADGQMLFGKFNCVGCHSHGGGGMGPPLMDNQWIYGGEPGQIRATILQGRPNGMPSFRGKITDNQIWEIVAYVRSLSGNFSKQAAPGRSEDMSTPPPNSTPTQPPTQSFLPAGSERPT